MDFTIACVNLCCAQIVLFYYVGNQKKKFMCLRRKRNQVYIYKIKKLVWHLSNIKKNKKVAFPPTMFIRH